MHDVGKASPPVQHQSCHNNNNNESSLIMENKKWHAMSMHEIGFDDAGSQSLFKEEHREFSLTGFGSYLNGSISGDL